MDFLPEALDEALQAYLKHCPAEGYIKAEIPGAALGLDPITAAALAERLAQKGSLIRDAGRYGLPQKIDPPSGRAAEILQALQKANGESWDLDRDGRGGDRKEIGTLCARGLAIALDSSLFVSAHGYADYCGRILQGRPVGSAFTLGDAKSATGLSRKWIIPLLNRMERDGLVERDGETRRVLKKGTAGA
jgi:selenocysteine-specific elongation factor